MRDEEECFTPSVEDENKQDHSLDALRLGFKELYDEIDFLGEQATLAVQSFTRDCENESDVVKKTDIEDLIVYARKFVRETRKTIVSFDEHGVQCEPAERSNKKVSTPRAWMQPEPNKSSVRDAPWVHPVRNQSAFTVTQDVPDNVSCVLSDQAAQLNNKITIATAPEVRSIGTNVNFVSPRTVAKRTNVQRVVQPATVRSAKCSSAGELRPRPAVKPRVPPSTAPASTPSKQVKAPSRTFSDSQFKLLFERFVQMQSEKRATEELEHVAKEDGGIENDTPVIEESPSAEKTTEPADSAVETLGFTSHVLPGVSIKGRWDANLKVQNTGNIAILKDEDKPYDEYPNSNVLYVELKRGEAKHAKETAPNEKLPIVTDKAQKVVGKESSKSCVEDDPKIRFEVETSDSDSKASSYRETKPRELPQIRVPKSARKLIRHSNKPNKYLDPFINMNRTRVPSKQGTEELFDIFDGDSSSSNTEDDLGEDDIRMLLNLKEHVNNDTLQTSDSKSPKTEHVKQLPTSVQCQRSLLEVCSIPALHSPPSRRAKDESSESDGETASNACSSGKFLKNLRIWKSALEVQSQSMKISNELTENLDVLKDNIAKIAQASSKVTTIAQNVENIGASVDVFPRQRVPACPESSSLRSRSCECFGCQSTFEEPALRPMTSPPYDHKQFQRAILEHNPRYAKTIRKIYQLGSNGRPPSSAGVDRDETVKKAAQKFLLSLQGNLNDRNSYGSGSSLGLVHSSSKSMSDESDDAGEDSTLIVSENEYYSEPDVASASFSAGVYSTSDVSSAGQIVSSEGTNFSSLTIDIHSHSDMGEVLSPGEVK